LSQCPRPKVRPNWCTVTAFHLDPAPGDGLTRTDPILARYPDFAAMIAEAQDDAALLNALRRAETIGRPVGGEDFLKRLEVAAGRVLAPGKRGRKPKTVNPVGDASSS